LGCAGGRFANAQIPARPGGDDFGHIDGVRFARQQMIGAVQRHKTLWMFGGGVDFGGTIDTNDPILRGVEYRQCLVQIFDLLFLVLPGDVVEELLFNDERAPAKADLGGAALADFLERMGEVFRDMFGIERRADGGDGLDAGDGAGRASTAAPPRLWPMRRPGAA
jgi:hypothetical protein